MVQNVLNVISSVPPLLAYAIIALLVFGEAAFFLALSSPGRPLCCWVASWPARGISTSPP